MTHINKGNPFPLGSSLTSQGVNFSLVATNAEYVEILLFEEEDSIWPKSILKLDQQHNTGPYWHAEIKNLNEGCIYAVSYTHLRAHETPEHLVCRLLLEKKKNP